MPTDRGRMCFTIDRQDGCPWCGLLAWLRGYRRWNGVVREGWAASQVRPLADFKALVQPENAAMT
jgi:hypothetical protein